MGQRYRERDISEAWANMACDCIEAQWNMPLYFGRSGYSTNKTSFRKGGQMITPLPRKEWIDHGYTLHE